MENLFETLFTINVNDKTEKKGDLTYLSWAWAWAQFKKVCPDATYEIKRDINNKPYVKEDGVGYMVFTSVTAGGLTYEMWLPVMDYKNKAMLEPDMFDINKTIMRCLTKNLAMFGLGLYIYAGEDLPEEPKITDEQIKEIGELGIFIPKMLKWAGVSRIEDMPISKADAIIKMKKGEKNDN